MKREGVLASAHCFRSFIAFDPVETYTPSDMSVRLLIEILLGVTHAILNSVKLAELRLTPQSGFIAINSVIFEGALTERGRTKQ